MKFDYKTTVNAPVEFVFARLTDFEKFEKVGFGNISKFKPIGDIAAPEIGAKWKLRSEFQGRQRSFSLQLRELIENKSVVLGNGSDKFDVEASFGLAKIDDENTGFIFEINSSAKTITGRLIMQTMQLARSRIEKKLATDFDAMRDRMEADYQSKNTLA
ncbi:MAG: SRPBCC family protein [Rhodobacteraceae bacterium]|nr:SRPBCC family protein [Paracoccaceae bacterium]